MSKIKLYLRLSAPMTWEFLYSRVWPEIPGVKASIYADHFAMQKFEGEMEYLLRNPVPLTNPEKAIELLEGVELISGNFYEIDCDFTVKSHEHGYTLTIL